MIQYNSLSERLVLTQNNISLYSVSTQGLIDMKEGLGKMKKSVKQHFDQVDTMLVEMKGTYDMMTLQQLFQQLLKVQALFPQDQMFRAEGSQSVWLDSVLDGLMLQYIRQMPSQQSQPLSGKW